MSTSKVHSDAIILTLSPPRTTPGLTVTRRVIPAAPSPWAAPTRPCRIAWSRNCVFRGSASTIAAGNELLPGFLADYNARFGKEPHNPKNLHRPLSAGDDLADIFAWREERTVSNSLTLQYDKVVFLLEPNEITRELRRKRVTVVDYPDGRLAIRYRGLDLPYTTFDKLRQVSQASIVENKHLGAVLSYIRERQIERAEARSQSAPRRQGQLNPMFKVG
jgi:hypothetical protein